MRTDRPEADIPTPPITLSLALAAVVRLGSVLALQAATGRKGWQRLVGWADPISDDAFMYALERYRLADLRAVLVWVNHRQVCAQIDGPELSTVLDVEPIRPGEDEAQAALRLLGRIRRLYGPRFFDVVTVDAWYAQGPWLRAVQKLGWGVVCVLKQERYELHQEASALRDQQPPRAWESEGRRVRAWEVKDLSFTDSPLGLLLSSTLEAPSCSRLPNICATAPALAGRALLPADVDHPPPPSRASRPLRTSTALFLTAG